MNLYGFIIGILWHYFFYPQLFLIIFWVQKPMRFILSLVLGFFCMWMHASDFKQLNDNKNRYHEGHVVSFYNNHHWLMKINQDLIYLQCYDHCPKAYPGEMWAWVGRIHPRIVQENPGTSTLWYRDDLRHIHGISSALYHSLKKIKDMERWDGLNRLKVYLYKQASHLFSKDQVFAKKIFLALVLGIGGALDSTDWELFKSTGTAHLMVVSGAHLSLIMGLIGLLIGGFWRCSSYLCFLLPEKRAASIISLLIGLLYAFLSGFGIPIQRALCMYFVYCLRFFLPYRIDTLTSFKIALWAILLIEPHAIFYPGTYLSFFAVYLLLATPILVPWEGVLKGLLQQFICLFGMAPLTLFWFSKVPFIGVFANLVAIPWVSWIVLPLSMLLALNLKWVLPFYHLSVFSLRWFLQKVQSYDFLNYTYMFRNDFIFYLSLLFLLAILLPLKKIRLVVLALLMISLSTSGKIIFKKAFLVDVLDVGQGLAVFVRTTHHHLLFDTAGKVYGRAVAEKTILPYFKHEGIQNLDMVVLSHPDMDHIGGAELLSSNLSVKLWLNDKSCQKQLPWVWDGVHFEFLKYHFVDKKKNNHSCVLKINNGQYQILLTADIERPVEYQLIHRYGAALKSTVLVVPHHGSLTSSSAAFLDLVKPIAAVVSVAKINAYHLPHQLVEKRYQNFNIAWFSTAKEGMVRFLFTAHYFKRLSWRNRSWLENLRA